MAVKTDFRNYFASEKIAVDAEFDNIILVDPNKVVTPDGVITDRLVQHENLVMYANLEARVLPRTKLATGMNFDEKTRTVEIANFGGNEDGKINFLKPQGKQYLDTSWTNQFTGQDSLIGGGINQTQQQATNGANGTSQFTRTIRNSQDTQLLGITSIKISNNSSFIPQVQIELTDVQGRTLFEQGENSPYSAFMQLPYPLFYLTVKGYYGKAIRYELMLKSFNARFDPTDGNYKISLSFIGRTAAILSDLPLGTLFALPHMYESTVQIEDGNQTNANGDNTGEYTDYQRVTVTKGYKKITEVFNYYKNQGLIDESLPVLTLSQLAYRLNALEQFITDTFQKEDLTVLNDIDDYRKTLFDYRAYVTSFSKGSWAYLYLDPVNRFVSDKGIIYYTFKKEINDSNEKIEKAFADLRAKIEKYNDTLNENVTFGEDGTFEVKSMKVEKASKISTAQAFQFTIGDILKDLDPEIIDYEKTFILQKGFVPTITELATFSAATIANFNFDEIVLDATTLEVRSEGGSYFSFGQLNNSTSNYKNSFLYRFDELEQKFSKNAESIETILSEALSQKIENPEGGLGFKPTIKNVMAYLMASVDAFYRMMDDVHREAWNLKDDPVRLQVLPGDSDATDSKDMIDNGDSSQNRFIYPWPQYFEKEIDADRNESYVIKYLGDPLVAARTKGYLWDKWPEVEFVEQYIKGYLQREEEPSPDAPQNQKNYGNFIAANPVEYPYDIVPYSDLSIVPFLYELWERTYLISNYSNVFRTNQDRRDLYAVYGDFEAATISEAIKSDPFLQMSLKQYQLRPQTFEALLENISNNGTGPSWNLHVRDNFVTPYIRNYVQQYYGLYDFESWWNSPTMELAQPSQERLREYLKDKQTNDLSLVDVYPFTDAVWLRDNMSDGKKLLKPQDFNDTTGTYFFSDEKKSIVSFDPDSFDTLNFTPALPTNWLTQKQISATGTTKQTLNASFIAKVNQNSYSITEGKIDYGSDYQGEVNKIQSISLLNTPYFINSLVQGVQNEKNGDDNPYVALGYMFVNSLPVATLREKFLQGDYSHATFNKFAALHKVNAAWVYKMGSIWYRYKKYHEQGVDILDDVWKSIDEGALYDPQFSGNQMTYDITRQNGGLYNYEMNSAGLTNNLTSLGFANVGVYPEVINSVSYFLGAGDVMTGYTQTDWANAYSGVTSFYGGGLRLGTPFKSKIDFAAGTIPSSLGKTVTIQNWYSYYDKPEMFSYSPADEVVVFPSAGGLNFSQYRLEKTTTLGTVKGNPVDQTLYDGSVRALWGAGHYGYFDNSNVRKPAYNEYIKVIDPEKEKQQAFNLTSTAEYANIEEILAVFPKEILDLFENKFLDFCKPTLSNAPDNEIGFSPNGFEDDTRWYNIKSTLETLFVVTRPELTGDEDQDGMLIAKSQLRDFTNSMNFFMNFKYIFKQGNPGGFDRRVWDSFVDGSQLNPVDKINFGAYVANTLPTENGVITLAQSQALNPDAWTAMYLNVGEYSNAEYLYSDDGSYLTDFFVDMNIEFTAENVQRLDKIIQIYANEKFKNPDITPAEFNNTINNYLLELNKYQANVQNHLFEYLNKNLPTITEVQENKKNVLDSEVAKVEIYETFKVLNDKWIAGGDFQNRTLFEDFLFLDRANRNIGDKIVVDVRALTGRLSAKNDKNSIYSMIGFILQENNFIFMALPAYVNFYGVPDPSKNGTPLENVASTASDAFGTFLEVDTRTTRPKFLCLYTDKPSEHPNLRENPDYRFRSDSFDMKRSDNPLRENQSDKTDWGLSNKVVGFNVDFGIQNQNMFQSISLDQSQYKDTSETFSILTDMANQAKGQKATQQSTSLFNLYKSRSYTCEVTSMGNVMIQPTMYFNLRYVPMFNGPYWITDVTHTITPNNFNTMFSGVRLSKFSYPKVNDLIMSVNVDLLRKYKKPRKVETPAPTPTPTTSASTQNQGASSNTNRGSDGKCDGTKYPNLEFLPVTQTKLPYAVLLSHIKNNVNPNTDLRRFITGIGAIEQTYPGLSNVIGPYNGNFGGIRADLTWSDAIASHFVGQTCLHWEEGGREGYYPYAAFEDYRGCVSAIDSRFRSLVVGSGGQTTVLKVFKNKFGNTDEGTAKAYAALWKGFWNTGLGYKSDNYASLYSNIEGDGKSSFDFATTMFLQVIRYAKNNGF